MQFSKTPRAVCTLVIVSLLAVLAPRVEAQVLRPAKKQTGVVNAAAPTTTAIKPDLVALSTTSDLIIEDLGFTGKGEITFELRNRGEVPINPPTPPITDEYGNTITEGVPQAKQILVNAYVNDLKVGGYYVLRLGGKASETFSRSIHPERTPRCAQEMLLKTVIDSANVIVELTETNNVTSLMAVRPCPDLAVASIKKKFNNPRGTGYVARVTLVNKGNAPVDSFEYLVYSVINGQGGHSAPGTGGPLAPGQTMELNSRSASGNDTMLVRVKLDEMYPGDVHFIEELDETNNLMEKMLD